MQRYQLDPEVQQGSQFYVMGGFYTDPEKFTELLKQKKTHTVNF